MARIALLSNYEEGERPGNNEVNAAASTSTVTLIPHSQSNTSNTATGPYGGLTSQDTTPRPSLDETGVMGIGNLMLADQSLDSPRSLTAHHSSGSGSIDGLPRSKDSFSLQQMLDPPRVPGSTSSSSIGLGRPSHTSPEGVRYHSSRPGSRDSSVRSVRKVSRPAVGLDDEVDLTGVDGVEDMEMMLDPTSEPGENGSGNRSRISSMKAMPPIPDERTRDSMDSYSEERPLPPLPPTQGDNARPRVSPRMASLGIPQTNLDHLGLGSGSGPLVNPSTSGGTISQRRHSRQQGMGSIGSIDEVSFPKAESSRPSTASTSGSRSRAKSEVGKRPLQMLRQGSSQSGTMDNLPPIPSLKPKVSFSGTGTRSYPDNGIPNGLAPPVSLHSKRLSAQSSLFSSGTGGSLISPLPEEQPHKVLQRPFHLLRLLYNSMDPDKSGSYLTGTIHISSAVWRPLDWGIGSSSASVSGSVSGSGAASVSASGVGGGAGPGGGGGGLPVNSGPGYPASTISSSNKHINSDTKNNQPKIAAQEVKAKCIDLLVGRLEDVREKGLFLVEGGPREAGYQGGKGGSRGPGVLGGAEGRMVDEFMGALDALEDEMESMYKALLSKGVVLGSWKGKKTSSVSDLFFWCLIGGLFQRETRDGEVG